MIPILLNYGDKEFLQKNYVALIVLLILHYQHIYNSCSEHYG